MPIDYTYYYAWKKGLELYNYQKLAGQTFADALETVREENETRDCARILESRWTDNSDR